MKLWICFLICLLSVGCVTASPTKESGVAAAPAPATDSPVQDRQIVENLCHDYGRGMNERNADLILSMFTDDGSYITRVDKVNKLVSKAEYAALCPDKFELWNRIGLNAKARVKSIAVAGDKADGTMTMKFWGPGWNSEEHYAMKFEKRAGRWMIIQVHDE